MIKMKTLAIDLETYSSVDLVKCGVYPYVESPDFEILLFAYSINEGPVEVVDLAKETIHLWCASYGFLHFFSIRHS